MKVLGSIRNALRLLSRRDRRVLLIVLLAQIVVSILDLFAILALGFVAAVSTEAATGNPINVGGISSFIGQLPASMDFIVFVAFVAAIVLVVKSVISLWLTRRSFRFVANRQAIIAGNIAARLLNRPLLEVQARSSQEISIALSTGVNAITIGTIGPALVMASEISLVAVLFFGLILVDPLVAGFTVVFFALLAISLQYLLGNWATDLGERQTNAEIGSMASIQHALRVYREITVTGRRGLFISRFQQLRWEAANVQADIYILSQVGKYVFEIGLIVGAGLLVSFIAMTEDLTAAVAIVVVFLAASGRIFPSLMRLQTGMSTIRNSAGASLHTYQLIDALDAAESSSQSVPKLENMIEKSSDLIRSGFPDFSASVMVEKVTLSYPGATKPALDAVSLSVMPGESVALVGATGAGKSTLADVILGITSPNSGSVMISGLPPLEVVRRWPGAMAYVPQDVAILTGTVRENVALGIPLDDVDDNLVWDALERAQLSSFLASQREGIETIVGENGVKLSGGQRQRLGIARALYSRPRLLVLDEATSALDSETEQLITKTLDSLAGEVTLIIIAHRLATVRHSNLIVYLDEGRVLGSGTFNQLRLSVPDFDRQAALLGL